MPRPVPQTIKGWLAAALTWNAGYVDAVGYLILLHVYTAHMSGNSVALGIDLEQLDWSAVFQRGWPILTFVIGLILCSLINSAGERRQFRKVSSITLGIEAFLLALFMLLAPALIGPSGLKTEPTVIFLLLVPLLTIAMGLQTSTLNRVGGLTLYTTYVTGTLAKFADGVAEYLTWFYFNTRRRSRHRMLQVARISSRHRAARESALMARLWLGYIAGAVCGALMKGAWRSTALALPFAVLVVLVIIDQHRPIAPPSPQKQKSDE